MLGTGVNNGADGKPPGPLPSCPRGSGPPAQPSPAQPSPAVLRRQESCRAGQWSQRRPRPCGRGSRQHIPHQQGAGRFRGRGHTLLPTGGCALGGLAGGLGMGTARGGGDLYLSRALYLHRNLLRGWTLPLPFTGRDWPRQTLHPRPGGSRAWRGGGCGLGHPPSSESAIAFTGNHVPETPGPSPILGSGFYKLLSFSE